MVARLVRDQEAVGSNPVSSTIQKGQDFSCPFCMLSVIRTRLLGTNQAQRGVPENCKFLGKRRYGEKSATARKGGRRKATVSTRFGTKRPWVRIPSPRPYKKDRIFPVLFVCSRCRVKNGSLSKEPFANFAELRNLTSEKTRILKVRKT